MEKRWVGCASDNFRAGRPAGFVPEIIVLHSINGGLNGAISRFNQPGAQTSAHYAVGNDGSILQFVSETDTAFHAGLVINPTAPLVRARERVNPNFYSIAIEHEGLPSAAWPEARVQASAQLIADVAMRWKIPLDSEHIISHSAIRSSVNCAGQGCDIAKLIAIAREKAGRPNIPAQRTVRTTARANLRRAPRTSADIVQVLPADTPFTAAAFTEGERVSGNSFWYSDESQALFLWAGATDFPNPVGTNEATPDESHSTDLMERPIDVPVSPETLSGLPIDRTQALPAKDYYGVQFRKDLIVLHFTAGLTAKSALDTWRNDPNHIATAYVIDHDGTIYEAFNPHHWAYHLGIKGTSLHDKRSIGIEIANAGPLRQVGQSLNWWPSDFGRQFCTLDQEDRYVRAPFRSMNHFAAFPAVQTQAIAQLVNRLCEQFSIPKTIATGSARFEFDPSLFANFRGIATHANYRADKWDIGPAYPWETLGL